MQRIPCYRSVPILLSRGRLLEQVQEELAECVKAWHDTAVGGRLKTTAEKAGPRFYRAQERDEYAQD